MSFSFKWQPVLAVSLVAVLLSACSFDPSARKQKDFQSGQSFFQKGEYRAATAEYARAIRVDPSYADAHFQLGQSYMLLQEPDRAYQEFARTVELRPDDYQARLAMANLAIMNRSFRQAKEQTDWLLKARPNDPAVHSAIASLLAAQDDISGAIQEAQQTVTLAPGRWEPYLTLALLQAKNGQDDAAEASFKKVIEMDPRETKARVLLGSYYQSRNRLDDAERQFHDAMATSPAALAPRTALARLYMVEGKPAQAESTLEQAKRDLPNDPECGLALSNFYYVTGNLDKAVAEYDALYAGHPSDVMIKKKYVQLLIQTKHFDKAQQLDKEILNANANDTDALVYRSQIQISEGDLNDATQTLQTVVTNAPNDSLAHYALGVALNKQGYPERAESEWKSALQLNPDFLEAERALGDEAMLKGDMSALEDAANQIIRLEPGSPEGYALRALCSINRNQFEDAERDVRRAISVAPQSAFGYVQLGNLRFTQKQYSDAAKAYQDALDRNSGSTDALHGLMNTYMAEKQPDQAIAAAQAQVNKSPENSSFYDLLGSALFHSKKDLGGAQAAFQRAVALDGRNIDAWIQLCQVQANLGEIDQAIATDESALKLNPRQLSFDILLGDLYVARSEWKRAEDAYQAALALSPQNPIASNDLARVMLDGGGNVDVALSLVQTARRQLPNSPAVVDTLGWIYYHQGMYQLAVTCLQEALTLEQKDQLPDNPDIQYHLGMTYEKAKQPVLAKEHFEDALKADPNYRSASEIRAELARLQ